jgi:hypothetical protein
MKRNLLIVLILGISIHPASGQSGVKRTWGIKTDLSAFLTNTLSVEGELPLSGRFSVFAQAGIIRDGLLASPLIGIGGQFKAGLKLFPFSATAISNRGFFLRPELVLRDLLYREFRKSVSRELWTGAFLHLGYGLRKGNFTIEPIAGLGLTRWRLDDLGTMFAWWCPVNPPWRGIRGLGRSITIPNSHSFNSSLSIGFGLLIGIAL